MAALISLVVIAFLLHGMWERLHIVLYTNYDAMKGILPVSVLATIGDVMYTLFAVLFAALFKADPLWFIHPKPLDFVGLTVLGLCIAIFVEYKAMALKRWEYTERMPRVFGLGLSPLVQMTVLLPLTVYIIASTGGLF